MVLHFRAPRSHGQFRQMTTECPQLQRVSIACSRIPHTACNRGCCCPFSKLRIEATEMCTLDITFAHEPIEFDVLNGDSLVFVVTRPEPIGEGQARPALRTRMPANPVDVAAQEVVIISGPSRSGNDDDRKDKPELNDGTITVSMFCPEILEFECQLLINNGIVQSVCFWASFGPPLNCMPS